MNTFAQLDRAPQWYNIGTRVAEGSSTADMLEAASLARWDVRLEPTPNYGRSNLSQFDVVRTNPNDGIADTLGRVGTRYRVFQNEELFSFGDYMTGTSGQWEAAGSLKDGAVVFGAMRLNGELYLDHDDEIERHLIVYTSHDGSSNITVAVTALRMRCTNSLNFGLRHAKQTFKIRHSSSTEGKVQEAREVLKISNAYFDEFSYEMNKLIDDEITVNEALDIVKRAYPEPDLDKAGAHTRWENKVDDIFAIYNGETCENINGTAWGIANAMTERLDWYRNPRGGNMENIHAAASGFDNAINNEKQRILVAATR